MPKQKLTHKNNPGKQAMIKALNNSLGVVTTACKKVGISRATHYLWMTEDAEYAKAVTDLENVVLDFAESKLHKLINDGNVAATLFLLKTRGKERGYVERQELEHRSVKDHVEIRFLDED